MSTLLTPLRQNLQTVYQRHHDFVLLFILFVAFRGLALVAFRPGGLVLDHSDFYWYREFAQLTRQGYYPYYNIWINYPPLFPWVMVAIFQVSELIPPWDYANLWFTLLLGGFFLLFEAGNFILLYLLALELYPAQETGLNSTPALRPCWLYAALFVPVYTLTGWFENYPIFFFLLSLYLLLKNRPYLSAFLAGVGFMIKLFPVILLPIAAQLVSKKKLEIKHIISHFSLPFDLPRILIYLAIFAATVILIGLPFYLMNPALILGSQQINDARLPWQTIWALLDGNYNYGSLPLDLRNLAWNPANKEATSIPWLPITAGFGLIYAFFYTRPLNWRRPRIALAFVGFTVCLFMIWSKGYSPQWLGWVLFFIALLLPNLRGVIYAVILSVANIIEANFYFIIFPTEHWLFAVTILTRTFLFIIVGIEFLWLIWPPSARVIKIRAWAVAGVLAILLVGLIPAGLRLSQAYVDLRQQQSPYAATITRLQGEKVKGALLLNSHTTYDWFYPYLRRDYTLYMLDDYAPPGASVTERTTTLLNRITGQTKVLWIYDTDASVTTPAEEALSAWLGDTPLAHIQDIDGGRLYLFILR